MSPAACGAAAPDPHCARVPRGRRARLPWLGAGALLALAWALLAAAPPGVEGPPCAVRAATGLDCPSCGLTRALGALARGAWRESLALHPWAAALALQAVGAWALWGAWLEGRLRKRPDRWLPAALAANLAALALLWLARLATGTLPG